jgi:hypothetical protein
LNGAEVMLLEEKKTLVAALKKDINELRDSL